MAGSGVRLIDDALIDKLASHLIHRGEASRRIIVGIAGIPGSGKSTLGALLHDAVQRRAPGTAVLLPMDGFHFTTRRLRDLGLLHRKGAAETFDAKGYIQLIQRARDHLHATAFPIYDRRLHKPVLDHREEHTILPAVRIVLTEGNYLLLDIEPWSRLAAMLDACWFLDTPRMVARQWTIQRHIHGGRSPEDAADHHARNDAPNTTLVLDHHRKPDLVLQWGDVHGLPSHPYTA